MRLAVIATTLCGTCAGTGVLRLALDVLLVCRLEFFDLGLGTHIRDSLSSGGNVARQQERQQQCANTVVVERDEADDRAVQQSAGA